MEQFGFLFAIGTALCWSISLMMFKGLSLQLGAHVFNLAKNVIASILFFASLWLIHGRLLPEVNSYDALLLCLSGALGIGLADAMFLRALGVLGASRTAIIECAYAPAVMGLSILYLGEQLTLLQGVGTACVICALILVSVKPTGLAAKFSFQGTMLGLASVLAIAVGITMVKPVLATTDFWDATALRMGAGTIASAFPFFGRQRRRQLFSQLHQFPRKGNLFFAAFLGTYLTMVLWMAGFKYESASVVAVLNQLSTIFTVALAAIFLREPLMLRGYLAAAIAGIGTLLVTLT